MKSEFNYVSVLGYKVYSDNLEKIKINGEKCRVINCSISPNNYSIALRDPAFKEVLKNTDFLMLDGVYFALASIFLLGKNIKKNQGPDVYKYFIEKMNETSGRVFFLGSSETVLQKIKERLKTDCPNITVGTYSPPFKKVFSPEDNKAMITAINDFAPNIVFVGMTAPKQEKWSMQNRDYLNSNLVISIGNVFDWYAGTQKRIHPFFFKIRMAWLVRIFIRPEMLKRNLGNQMLFFWHLMLMVLRIKKQPAM